MYKSTTRFDCANDKQFYNLSHEGQNIYTNFDSTIQVYVHIVIIMCIIWLSFNINELIIINSSMVVQSIVEP
jgi:hypothetical protein